MPLEQGGALEQVGARIERVMGLTDKLSGVPKARRLGRRVSGTGFAATAGIRLDKRHHFCHTYILEPMDLF